MSELEPEIVAILSSVSDPEIPVLSVMDMGVIRDVVQVEDVFQIKITPTYSGCPAMDTIADDLIAAFKKEGLTAKVDLVLSPAWTTDWITEKGRKNLEEYGIAAPLEESMDKAALRGDAQMIRCTNCQSTNTKMISRFGSTACKALFQCNDCHEPFDYFKCLK